MTSFEKNIETRIAFYSKFMPIEKATKVAHEKSKIRRHKMFLMITQGAVCKECGTSENLTVDHIEPVKTQKRGKRSGNLKNKQLLCVVCNWKKSAGKRRDFNSPEARLRLIMGSNIKEINI